MSILEQGFLSPDIVMVREDRHHTLPELFEHVEGLNRTAQAMIRAAKVKVELDELDPKLVAFLLFARLVSNFQGTILMAESGLIVEARTLARTCLETAFHLAAVAEDPAMAELMVGHDLNSKRKMANWLSNRPNREDFLTDEGLALLKNHVDQIEAEWAQIRDLGTENVARRGGMEDAYIWYRQFSGDAAHPSLTALARYMIGEADGAGISLQWGPNIGWVDLNDTLLLACSFLLSGCVALNSVLETPLEEDAISQHWETYKRLLAEAHA